MLVAVPPGEGLVHFYCFVAKGFVTERTKRTEGKGNRNIWLLTPVVFPVTL